MRIYEQNRKWFTDVHAQGVNIWYNETFGGDDVCEIKIMKVKHSHHTLFPGLSNCHSSCCLTLACIFWTFKLTCLCSESFFWLIIQSVRLFMASYCHALGADVRCNGCNVKLMNKDKWYRCRYCINVNLCTQCFENGFTDASTGHSSSHENGNIQVSKNPPLKQNRANVPKLLYCLSDYSVIKISGFFFQTVLPLIRLDSKCDSCKGYITDTKLVCQSCAGIIYCLGCYKLGQHKVRYVRCIEGNTI